MIPTLASLSVVAVSLSTYTLAINTMSFLRTDDVIQRPYLDLQLHHAISSREAAGALSRRDVIVNADIDFDGRDEAVKINDNGTLNMTVWDIATDEACVKSLSALPRSSNPSGTCVCYNLPSLDAQTGIFEAELRLYRISEARDSFANVPPEDVRVSVQYDGASVSPVSADELNSMRVNQTENLSLNRRDSVPRLMKSYLFVGQIDKSEVAENLSMAALEAILIPTFTLTGTVGQDTVQTNVSMNEASFLTGVFSKSIVMSDFSAAQAAVTQQVNGLNNGTIAFVMPGTQIMIFPIGAIITSVWLVLGLAVYGFGTYERMRYADIYQRRKAITARKPTF